MQKHIKNIGVILVAVSLFAFSVLALQAFAAADTSRQVILRNRIDFLNLHITAAKHEQDLYRSEIKRLGDQVFEWVHEIEGHEYELSDQPSGK